MTILLMNGTSKLEIGEEFENLKVDLHVKGYNEVNSLHPFRTLANFQSNLPLETIERPRALYGVRY